MATKKELLKDFHKQAIGNLKSRKVKGGFATVPASTSSTGFINWDDVIIRGGQNAAVPNKPGFKKRSVFRPY